MSKNTSKYRQFINIPRNSLECIFHCHFIIIIKNWAAPAIKHQRQLGVTRPNAVLRKAGMCWMLSITSTRLREGYVKIAFNSWNVRSSRPSRGPCLNDHIAAAVSPRPCHPTLGAKWLTHQSSTIMRITHHRATEWTTRNSTQYRPRQLLCACNCGGSILINFSSREISSTQHCASRIPWNQFHYD